MPSVSTPRPEGLRLVAGTEKPGSEHVDNPDQQITTKTGNMRVWLEYVQPRAINDSDVVQIKELVADMYNEPTVEGVVTDLFRGDLSLWRLKGEAKGIVILQFVDEPGGREMLIWGLLGKNVASHFQHVQENFEKIAKAAGCRWIALFARSKRLTKIYTARGDYKTISHFQVKELKDETLQKL